MRVQSSSDEFEVYSGSMKFERLFARGTLAIPIGFDHSGSFGRLNYFMSSCVMKLHSLCYVWHVVKEVESFAYVW